MIPRETNRMRSCYRARTHAKRTPENKGAKGAVGEIYTVLRGVKTSTGTPPEAAEL